MSSGRSRGPASAAPVVVGSVLARPWLWPAAVSAVLRLARPGWWRHWPPVPLPDPDLWRFRMETAYGGRGDAVPVPEDVLSFLRWTRDMTEWRKL
ncbi:MAG: hypothetical protein ACYDA2_09900 [Acidimicrobiales bacterium]